MSTNELPGSAGHLVQLFATVQLPFPGLERATSALRGQLRSTRDQQAFVEDPTRVLDWDTLIIDGPTVEVDSRDRSWFVYTAQVLTRALRRVD